MGEFPVSALRRRMKTRNGAVWYLNNMSSINDYAVFAFRDFPDIEYVAGVWK